MARQIGDQGVYLLLLKTLDLALKDSRGVNKPSKHDRAEAIDFLWTVAPEYAAAMGVPVAEEDADLAMTTRSQKQRGGGI